MLRIEKVDELAFDGVGKRRGPRGRNFETELIEACLRNGVPLNKIGYRRKTIYERSGKC